MSVPAPFPLLGEFAPATYEAWKAEAEKLLKGAPFDKKMFTPTPEGITLQPIYRKEDAAGLDRLNRVPGEKPFVRGAYAGGYLRTPWRVSQTLFADTIGDWNEAARQDLLRGQTELPLTLSAEPAAHTPSISKLVELQTALDGIDAGKIPLFLHPSPEGLAAPALLLAWVEVEKLELKHLSGCLGFDPMGQAARSGKLDAAWPRDAADLLRHALEKLPNLRALVIDASLVPDAGGSAVQELGYFLAAGSAYLSVLLETDLPANRLPGRIRQVFGIGPNFFMEISKFRAARVLWTRLLEAYGLEVAPDAFDFHARTSRWNKSWIDAHTNLLRGTTEAFSAVLGGVQGLDVEPYDCLRQCPDAASRRAARNTQIILAEECELTRVIDPAGGSWFVEWLTDKIAGEAWKFFQQIEQQGGLAAALQNGWLQGQLATTAKRRADDLGKRRATLTGVNNYPNPQEPLPPLERVRTSASTAGRVHFNAGDLAQAIQAFRQGADLTSVAAALRGKPEPQAFPPLVLTRGAEAYETLRRRCASASKPPVLLQLNIGPSREYRARADWTSAFFRVGGIRIVADRDFATPEEALEACKETKPSAVILVSTDARYLESAVPLAKALKSIPGSFPVFLAGAPGEQEAEWKAAGIDDFVHVRVDNGAFLKQFLDRLEA